MLFSCRWFWPLDGVIADPRFPVKLKMDPKFTIWSGWDSSIAEPMVEILRAKRLLGESETPPPPTSILMFRLEMSRFFLPGESGDGTMKQLLLLSL